MIPPGARTRMRRSSARASAPAPPARAWSMRWRGRTAARRHRRSPTSCAPGRARRHRERLPRARGARPPGPRAPAGRRRRHGPLRGRAPRRRAPPPRRLRSLRARGAVLRRRPRAGDRDAVGAPRVRDRPARRRAARHLPELPLVEFRGLRLYEAAREEAAEALDRLGHPFAQRNRRAVRRAAPRTTRVALLGYAHADDVVETDRALPPPGPPPRSRRRPRPSTPAARRIEHQGALAAARASRR